MEVLPLGSVRPEGELRIRLEAQRDGLTGHAEELYADIGRSDWLTGANAGKEFSWECGPYYARGLVALALVLQDETLKAKAKRWVNAVIVSQRENGDFGPRKDNWWANMLSLGFLCDWTDATGDARVVPFLERYFAYQERRFDEKSLADESCWACARGGDETQRGSGTNNTVRINTVGSLLNTQGGHTRAPNDTVQQYSRGGLVMVDPSVRRPGVRVHVVSLRHSGALVKRRRSSQTPCCF